MGFQKEMEAIFDYLPAERQTFLYSATQDEYLNLILHKIIQDEY